MGRLLQRESERATMRSHRPVRFRLAGLLSIAVLALAGVTACGPGDEVSGSAARATDVEDHGAAAGDNLTEMQQPPATTEDHGAAAGDNLTEMPPPETAITRSSSPVPDPPDQVLAAGGSDGSTTTIGSGTTSSATPPTTTSESRTRAMANCLVGEWVITAQELQSYYDQLGSVGMVTGMGDANVTFEMSGSMGVTFRDDASLTFTPDYSLTMEISLDGTTAISGTGVVSGTLDGTYSVSAGTVALSYGADNTTLVVTAMGNTTTIDSAIGSAFPFTSAPFECGSAGPILIFGAGSSGTVPIQLIPA